MHTIDPKIQRTIKKMLRSQEKKKEVLEYMQQNTPHLLSNPQRAIRVRDCGNVLMFAKYKGGETKLTGANFCKYDKFCLACSTRRAIHKIQHFIQGVKDNQLEDKYRYHITLTIRHSKKDSLERSMDRIMHYKKVITQRVRNAKRENHKSKSFFSKFLGMVTSIEVTYSEKSGRHPHMHLLVCSDERIGTEYVPQIRAVSNKQLMRERYGLTKDSFCVAMRGVDVRKNHFERQGIAEVFKYAVKFSSLSVPKLVELIALQKRKQYRFYATTGIFRGRKRKNTKNSHMCISVQDSCSFLYENTNGYVTV